MLIFKYEELPDWCHAAIPCNPALPEPFHMQGEST